MLLWGLVVAWLPSLKRGAKQRALWLIYLSLALSKTVTVSSVAAWINDQVGQHNANTLVQHLLGIVSAVALLRFISLISGAYEERPRARATQLGVGLVVALALIVLFSITDDGVYSSADELLASPIAEPATIVYWLLMEVYLGVALTMGGLLLWRVSRQSPTNLLRVGLWVMCAGALLNVLYAVYKSGYVLAHAAGVGLPTGIVASISNNMLLAANLFMVAGAALPAWTVARKVVQARRSMRALAPLWSTMRETFPEMILYVSQKLPAADGILATARLRLYRRLIEIRDGMLELRGYVPADVAEEALHYLGERGVHGEEAVALAEACWIEVALRKVRAGAEPEGTPGGTVQGGGSVEEEDRWLSRVSQAHARSPYPAEFADWREVTPASSRSPAPTL
ncbi:MAG: MAB_1171c family putative transporter [Kibdelosporangium sp.]